MKTLNVRFCGLGGQGIVLSAVVLGTAAVTQRNMYGVQTQSYGSEARGGQCQAELILSDEPINSPVVESKDVLVAMSQSALDRYLPSLRPDGTLIIDPHLVLNTHGTTARVIEVPATEIASGLGNRIVANMVIMGFLQEATQILSRDDLLAVIKDSVPAKYLDLNIKAVDAGIEIGRGVRVEV